jgi:hypothetical protein
MVGDGQSSRPLLKLKVWNYMLLPKLCYRIAEVEAEPERSSRHNSSKAKGISVHGHTDCIHKTAWKSTLAMDWVTRAMGPGTPSGFSDNVDVGHSGARLNPMHNKDINSILYTVGYSLFYLVSNLVNQQTIFTATSQSQGTTPLFAPSHLASWWPCWLHVGV